MEYEITIADIQAYLASLAPTDTVGDTKTTTNCLVARALARKYGETFDVGYKSFTRDGSTAPYPIDELVSRIIHEFDALGSGVNQYPTRGQVEQAIPVLA